MDEKKRVLHLMRDEKFLDYFIEQSERIMPDGSVYWIAVDQPSKELSFIKSSLVTRVEWTKSNMADLIKKANQYDKLVLHSLFFTNLNFFLNTLKTEIEIIWIFWGGDGYSYTAKERQWYQPLTWQYRKNVFKKNVNVVRAVVRQINMARLRMIKSFHVRKAIKRVDICATWIKYDYEMIKHINPRMKWAYYIYFTAEQMGFKDLESQPLNKGRLWLGNSSTDTNNHIDALHFLKEINWQGEIITPLSYGSKPYAKKIIELGKGYFDEKFIPLTELMPLDRYQQLMNSCGIVWMNHIRQQAAGNLLAALYMGKAVIMNRNNNLYKTFRDWGMYIENPGILKNIDAIQKETFKQNKDILITQLSSEKNSKILRKIYYDG